MYATYVIWTRHMRKFVQQTEELFGLALQSVLWVVLFGVGMRGMISSIGGNDYMSFILPGIIALSALGGAVGGGWCYSMSGFVALLKSTWLHRFRA